jgi:adenylosuccinate synthase
MTDLALTKLDVLDSLPVIKVCTGYRAPGSTHPVHYWEGDADWLSTCQPIYEELPGWQQTTREARIFAELPIQAQAYVRRVEELTQTPVSMVSIGPDREETIHL